MANLGNCLLFYLKYYPEMERLYEEEEPNVDGLPDAEEVLKKITLVGDAASREGAELLEACAPGIEERLRKIAEVQRSRNKLEDSWDLRYRLLPKEHRVTFGASIGIASEEWHLVPWLWCRGGRRAENEVVRILGRGETGARIGWGSGIVALTTIDIPIPDVFDAPVARDPLVNEVHQAFATLTPEKVKAIAAMAGNRE